MEMHSHTFDTHEYIKELIKAGLKEKQAEVIVKGFLQSRDYDFSRLATKEQVTVIEHRSEERRVGKERRSQRSPDHYKENEEKLTNKIEATEEKQTNKVQATEQKLTANIEST